MDACICAPGFDRSADGACVPRADALASQPPEWYLQYSLPHGRASLLLILILIGAATAALLFSAVLAYAFCCTR